MDPNTQPFQKFMALIALFISLLTGVPRDGIILPQENGASFEATQKATEIAIDILSRYDTEAYDLTVSFMGDSITAGSDDYPSYPYCVGQILNTEVTNLGIGGSGIAEGSYDPMYMRFGDIPANSDVIILYAGVNDAYLLTDGNFGNSGEPGTFCYSLYTLLTGIKFYYPEAYFLVVIPPPVADFELFQTQNPELYNQDIMRKEIIRQCKELGIDRLDLYSMNVMNPLDPMVKDSYYLDYVHPNDEGAKMLAMLIAAKIAKHAEEGCFNQTMK